MLSVGQHTYTQKYPYIDRHTARTYTHTHTQGERNAYDILMGYYSGITIPPAPVILCLTEFAIQTATAACKHQSP